MKHLENGKDIEKKITTIEQEKEAGKNAIQSYVEFIELFGNLAQRIQKLRNMEELDFALKKIFSNFVVDGKIVTKITQNSPFGELCGTPDSVMVDQPPSFWNQLIGELKQLYAIGFEAKSLDFIDA